MLVQQYRFINVYIYLFYRSPNENFSVSGNSYNWLVYLHVRYESRRKQYKPGQNEKQHSNIIAIKT